MNPIPAFLAWLSSHLARSRAAKLAAILMMLVIVGVVAWFGLAGLSEITLFVLAFAIMGLVTIAGLYLAVRTLGFARRTATEIVNLRSALQAVTQRATSLGEDIDARTSRFHADIQRVGDNIQTSVAADLEALKAELSVVRELRSEVVEVGGMNALLSDKAAIALKAIDALQEQQAEFWLKLDSLEQELGRAHARSEELGTRLHQSTSRNEILSTESRIAIDAVKRDLAGLQAQNKADLAHLSSSVDLITRTMSRIDALRTAQADLSASIDAHRGRLEVSEQNSAQFRDEFDRYKTAFATIENQLREQLNAQETDRNALARLERELVAVSGLSVAMHDRVDLFSSRCGETATAVEYLSSKHAALEAAFHDAEVGIAAINADGKMHFEQLSFRLRFVEEHAHESARLVAAIQDRQVVLETAVTVVARDVTESSERISTATSELNRVDGRIDRVLTDSKAGLARLDALTESLRDQTADLDTRLVAFLNEKTDTVSVTDSLASWQSEADRRIDETNSSIQIAAARLEKIGDITEKQREQTAGLAAHVVALLNHKTEVASTIDGIVAWRSEVESRADATDNSLQVIFAKVEDIRMATEVLRDQAGSFAKNVAILAADRSEVALAIERLTSWKSDVDAKVGKTESSIQNAAESIHELRKAMDPIRHEAADLRAALSSRQSAIENALKTAHDLEQNFSVRLRDIAAKVDESSGDHERRLVNLVSDVRTLEELVKESPYERLRIVSEDLADLVQLVNETELGLVGDIAKLSGQTIDHEAVLGNLGKTVRNLESVVKDVRAVSTEFSAVVARVDSRATTLSQTQSDLLQRLEAIESAAAPKEMPSDDDLGDLRRRRIRQDDSKLSKSSKKTLGKKRGAASRGSKKSSKASRGRASNRV